MIKKKKNLWALPGAAILVAACIVLLPKPEKSIQEEGSGESTHSQELSFETELSVETQESFVYEDDAFTFTADQFRERFMDSLPEDYCFAENVYVNEQQEDTLQVDILDSTGTPTGILAMLEAAEMDQSFDQIALSISADCSEDDADILLEWYISVFLDRLDTDQRKEIHEDFYDMFHTGSEDYRLHSGQSHAVMMTYREGETEGYYYVVINVE